LEVYDERRRRRACRSPRGSGGGGIGVAPQVRQFAQQMDKELAAAFDPQYMQSRLPDHPPRWRSSNERLGA
jgi:hypothetical protein